MKKYLLAGLTFLPVLAFAQGLEGIINETIIPILGSLIPIMFAIAFLVFAWGVITYVLSSDDPAKKSAKSYMIYGIVGLAVMASVWGLVKILQETVGVESGEQLVIPEIPGI